MQKVIGWLYNLLFFFTPLIFFTKTSEFFEFNKIIFVYALTVLIITAWAIRCVIEKKLIFHRTALDIPIILYLFALLLSTIFSIDPHTSIFGYYSRFNGGLLSIFAYSLLYWAFVSNITSLQAMHTTYYMLLTTILISVIGILEHFGVFTTCKLIGLSLTENCWVQDVQNRVFSTLGQPNWLAGYIVAISPIIFNFKFLVFNKYKILSYLISILLFTTLLFTKSRSGLLAFGISYLIFWGLIFLKSKVKYLKEFICLSLAFAFLAFIFWPKPIPETKSQVSVIETGGTDSGKIREIVWSGAIEIWKTHPILGTGPETFAYSYNQLRPVEHNLTSEWDYTYNTAHNELLNHLANTGIIGTLSYLALVTFSITQIYKSKNYYFLAGYIGLLIVNFFNFSVVATQLQLFLFPALAVVGSTQYVEWKKQKISTLQKKLIASILLSTCYILLAISKYWLADFHYAKNNIENTKKAIEISPKEAIYHIQLANLYANEKDDNNSVSEIKKALELSPANVNLKKLAFTIYLKLANINNKYLQDSADILKSAIIQSPTNPKFYYNLGLLYARTSDTKTGLKLIEKATELKPNYKEARFAYALLLIDAGETKKAKSELEYILSNIDPNDTLTQQTLDKVK